MENVFVYPLRTPSEKLVTSVAKMAKEYRMAFRGDSKSGSFAGGPRILGLSFNFRGSYQVKGDKLYITINEKPALVSYSQTFDFLRKILDQA
jgi:hypothetical protein